MGVSSDRKGSCGSSRCWRRSSMTHTSRPSKTTRSEERRVGKECRSRWSPDQEKKKGQVLPEDLLKYGLIPEFVGRLPVITNVHNLDKTFFFSSRSRHTSFSRDWSSDVCSSD